MVSNKVLICYKLILFPIDELIINSRNEPTAPLRNKLF